MEHSLRRSNGRPCCETALVLPSRVSQAGAVRLMWSATTGIPPARRRRCLPRAWSRARRIHIPLDRRIPSHLFEAAFSWAPVLSPSHVTFPTPPSEPAGAAHPHVQERSFHRRRSAERPVGESTTLAPPSRSA